MSRISANGKLKELNCRNALLALEHEEILELPRYAVRYASRTPEKRQRECAP